VIRPATPDDVAAIVNLLADDPLGRIREDTEDLKPYHDAFELIAADPRTSLAVYQDDAQSVIGCIQLTFIAGMSYRGERRCLIEDLRVATTHRRRGVGSALVSWALDQARLQDCGLVELFMHRDRVASRQLYERLGFGQEHDGFRLRMR
jgi:GNAT superfamily N-acetyltransferase